MEKIDLNRNLVRVFSTLIIGMVAFQNCSPVKFASLTPESSEFLSTAALMINNGAKFTNDIKVSLQIRAESAAMMYVTNVPGCASGGDWEAYRPERNWFLAEENTTTSVYAKFKSTYDVELPCLGASIVHDNIAPTAEIYERPNLYTNRDEVQFGFRGDDRLSGVDHLECATTAKYQNCDSPKKITETKEGPHHFLARAIDRAGNTSLPADATWIYDKTPPLVKITEKPPALSNKPSAIFRFEAEDALSGIETIFCQLDAEGKPGSPQKDCASPAVYNGLASDLTETNYRFSVWAIDRAGNPSATLTYQFTVDRQPAGAFQIVGVTGGKDTKIDDLLGTVPNPTVHWTPSSMAEGYLISIFDLAGTQQVCPEKVAAKTATFFAYNASDCSLSDGKKYKAKVVAVDHAGNPRVAPLFTFTVDLSPPTIKIVGPILTNDDKDARFTFEISDPSGVESATCIKGRKVPAAPNENADCKNKTEITYVNQVPGDHTFQITATDEAGNSGASPQIPWTVNLIVCDPFAGVEKECVKGLKGNLWYLSAEQKKNPLNFVDQIIANGIQAKAVIYMSQLAVPTTPWTRGFRATDGSIVRDNEGHVLYEYFAMRFDTLLKLDPSKDVDGKYQFAILSDDGSLVEVKDAKTGVYRNLINNDNHHPTKMGCETAGLALTKASRIPLRIKYFQGPRYHIALTLMWRPMPTVASQLKDPLCGQLGNPLYFGPDVATAADMTHYAYGELIKRGWRPLTTNNFVLDEEKK